MERVPDTDGNHAVGEPAFSLPADLLNEENLFQVLGLRHLENKKHWRLTTEETHKAAKALLQMLFELDAVIGQCGLNHSQLLRVRIEVILSSCIVAEQNDFARSNEAKGRNGRAAKVHAAFAKFKPSTKLDMKVKVGKVLDLPFPYPSIKPGKPTMNVAKAAEKLRLRYEVSIQGLVTFQGRQRALTAASDYGLWHEDDERLGPSLIVVLEGVKKDGSVSTESDCLAFMSMVHDIRKQAGKVNSSVYGISTDTYTFTFWEVTSASEILKSAPMALESGYETRIVSHIRRMVCGCINLSPTTAEGKAKCTLDYGTDYRFNGAGFDHELKRAAGPSDLCL